MRPSGIAYDRGRRLTLSLEIEPRDQDVRGMLGEAHQARGHDRKAARYLAGT